MSLETTRAMRDHAAQMGAGMPKYLLAPEVAVLLSYIDDLNRRIFFETLWDTGTRVNEAMALTPGHYVLELAACGRRSDAQTTQQEREAQTRTPEIKDAPPPRSALPETTGTQYSPCAATRCWLHTEDTGIFSDVAKACETPAGMGHHLG
jgi:hypothetical protein